MLGPDYLEVFIPPVTGKKIVPDKHDGKMTSEWTFI